MMGAYRDVVAGAGGQYRPPSPSEAHVFVLRNNSLTRKRASRKYIFSCEIISFSFGAVVTLFDLAAWKQCGAIMLPPPILADHHS